MQRRKKENRVKNTCYFGSVYFFLKFLFTYEVKKDTLLVRFKKVSFCISRKNVLFTSFFGST